jgi:hypothetical protein
MDRARPSLSSVTGRTLRRIYNYTHYMEHGGKDRVRTALADGAQGSESGIELHLLLGALAEPGRAR